MKTNGKASLAEIFFQKLFGKRRAVKIGDPRSGIWAKSGSWPVLAVWRQNHRFWAGPGKWSDFVQNLVQTGTWKKVPL